MARVGRRWEENFELEKAGRFFGLLDSDHCCELLPGDDLALLTYRLAVSVSVSRVGSIRQERHTESAA